MNCSLCQGGVAPRYLQLVLAGVANGTAFFGCTNIGNFNKTFVLEGAPGGCFWGIILDTDRSTRCKLLNIFLFLRFQGGHYILDLDVGATDSNFSTTVRHAVATIDLGTTAPNCLTAIDGLHFTGFTGLLTPLHYDFSAATGDITIIP